MTGCFGVMLKVTLSKALRSAQSIQKIFPAPIVLKKGNKERKICKAKKLFKGDHNPAAAISRTSVKTNKRPSRAA